MNKAFDTQPTAASGQAGLVAVAVTILIALVLGSTMVSGLTRTNATRTIATKQSLQTYYVAQAGIQEALASRMLPRSNFLNNSATQAVNAYYRQSGRVYTQPDPVAPQGLLGRYQYVIVGGEPSVDTNGNAYPLPLGLPGPGSSLNPSGVPRALATDTLPASSSFMIISRGVTCRSADRSTAIPDGCGLDSNPNGTAQAGQTLDEITIVAQVNIMQENNGTPLRDRVLQQRMFKNSNQIQLPAGAWVPGYGWRTQGQNISFQQVFNATTPIKVVRVVFYNFANNEVIYDSNQAHPVQGQDSTLPSTLTVPTPIPPRAVIRLYFNQPIDYRSISSGFPNDRNLSQCQGATANQCALRVEQNVSATGQCIAPGCSAYGGNTIVPVFPGSAQVILLPPLTGTIAGGGIRHAVKVNLSGAPTATRGVIRTANGTAGTQDNVIIFQTN